MLCLQGLAFDVIERDDPSTDVRAHWAHILVSACELMDASFQRDCEGGGGGRGDGTGVIMKQACVLQQSNRNGDRDGGRQMWQIMCHCAAHCALR